MSIMVIFGNKSLYIENNKKYIASMVSNDIIYGNN
jgi:hypothetical protein